MIVGSVDTTISVVGGICVAVFASVTAPLILARRMDHQHREDREMDYTRQDAVAKQAAEAARLLAANQVQAAHLLKVNTAAVAETASQTQAQLAEIHTAVNSTLTGQMRLARDALAGQLATMRRLIIAPDADERTQMERIEGVIAELDATLADRGTPKGDPHVE